jgi:2-polyprenyl-3-methyl-5-hydroxy-6-metoxy-1,4-benzoquinol methylase
MSRCQLVRAPQAGPAPCRACGSKQQRHLYEVEGYAIDRCLACEFVQVRDEPSPQLLEAIYAALHLKHAIFRSEAAAGAENERRLKLLKRLVPEGASVLDVGCAAGDFLEIAKGSFLLSGMDISEGAIAVAKSRNPELADRLWAGRVEDIAAIDKGPFDAIVLWDVIEHLWDPVSTCRSLLRHLALNGLLVLSTPDSGALAARLMGKRWAFMIPPEHLSLFSQQSFRNLFETKLPGEIVYHRSLGKSTNAAFLVYKLDRMLGRGFPVGAMDWLARSPLGRLMIYVPTADIQYLAVRRPAE